MSETPVTLGGSGYAGTPMRLPMLLERIWTILRRQFSLFVRLGLPMALVMVCTYGALFGFLFAVGALKGRPATPGPTTAWMSPLAVCVCAVPIMIAYVFYEAAACLAALEANAERVMRARDAYALALRRAGALLSLGFLRAACVVLPGLAMLLVLVIAAVFLKSTATPGNAHAGALFLLVPLVIVLYGAAMFAIVWLALHFLLALPACLREGLGGWEAMRRSTVLTRGAKGRMFVVMLVAYVIGSILVFLFEVAAIGVAGAGGLLAHVLHLDRHSPAGLAAAIVVVAGLGGTALFLVVSLQWASYAIAFAVLYDDQRARLETMPVEAVP